MFTEISLAKCATSNPPRTIAPILVVLVIARAVSSPNMEFVTNFLALTYSGLLSVCVI